MGTKIRQKWNYKVLGLFYRKYSIYDSSLQELINTYPEQRFGQIFCNYICPDYRSETPTDKTKIWLMTDLFPKDMDFFYEEPWETFNRLLSGGQYKRPEVASR